MFRHLSLSYDRSIRILWLSEASDRASIHARFLVTCPRLEYREKYFFAERARAQQDDSLEGGPISLSPTGHYLIILARFVYQTMPCFLYRTRISRPIRGIFPRAIHKSHSQWINSVFESLKYHEIRFVKKVVDVQCRSTNFQFTIFSNYTIRLLFFGFLRDAISILFVFQQNLRVEF